LIPPSLIEGSGPAVEFEGGFSHPVLKLGSNTTDKETPFCFKIAALWHTVASGFSPFETVIVANDPDTHLAEMFVAIVAAS
jgi:hypothetical protein